MSAIQIPNEYVKRIFDFALKQGLTLTLLGVLQYYNMNKIEALESKINNCQGEQVELLKTTIKENTDAFKSFAEEWKDIKKN